MQNIDAVGIMVGDIYPMTSERLSDTSVDVHSQSATPPPPPRSERSADLPKSSAAVSTPRKRKIWSIAETLSSSTTEANSSSIKDDRERASTSVERKSWSDGRDSIPPSDSAGIGPSMANTVPPQPPAPPPPPPLVLPPGVHAITTVNGQIPQHFLQFHPWQQQQLAMAMAVRMPFHRPELLTMMAQSSHIRPHMIFNPMFMGAVMPSVTPQQPHHPLPTTHLSTPSSTSLSNG